MATERRVPDVCYLYALTFANGKRYVGVSRNPAERFKQHSSAATPCGLAFLEHGPPQLSVLLKAERSYCLEIETQLTRVWETCAPNGYNLQHGGLRGSVPCEESRDKMRLSHLGKSHAPETRAKMRAAHKQRLPITEETRERLRAAAKARGVPRATIEAGVAARRRNGFSLDRKAHSDRMKLWWANRKKGA